MSVPLPQPLETFFASINARDADGVAGCFTEDGLVQDEGGRHSGRAAIRAWSEETGRKYRFHADVQAIEAEADRTVVTAHVTGDFPGNPVDLAFGFKLANGLIADLEIS
jgi:uncharacterized protein (TIGR02246 family)